MHDHTEIHRNRILQNHHRRRNGTRREIVALTHKKRYPFSSCTSELPDKITVSIRTTSRVASISSGVDAGIVSVKE
jgi:hypothetical protein